MNIDAALYRAASWTPHQYNPAVSGRCRICAQRRYTGEHAAAEHAAVRPGAGTPPDLVGTLPAGALANMPEGMRGERHPYTAMPAPAAWSSNDCSVCGLPAAESVHLDPETGKPLTHPTGDPVSQYADSDTPADSDEPAGSDPDTGDDTGDLGAMIGCWLPTALGATLAPTGVDGAEEPDDLHLTLVMLAALPDAGDGPAMATVLAAVAIAAGRLAPFTIALSGVGVFTAGEKPVTYYSVDSPALTGVRDTLLDTLTSAGVGIDTTHGFTPHITLIYDVAAVPAPPTDPILIDRLTCAIGEDRYEFPLVGTGNPDDDDDNDDDDPADTGAVMDPGPVGWSQLSSRRDRAHTTPRPRTPSDDPTGTPATTDPTGAPVDAAVVGRTGGVHAERAFVTEANGKLLVTAPSDQILAPVARTLAAGATGNQHFSWLTGRLVGADEANRNGALWTFGDLQFGQPGVRHGPLNWLHEGKHVIGTLADSVLVPHAQAGDVGAHIATLAAVWSWLYPAETDVIRGASDSGRLWQSMECVSESVECAGDAGCGRTVAYGDYLSGTGTCTHLRERSAVRRFARPSFLGAAVIVPPVRPGWAGADTRVLSALSEVSATSYEAAGCPDMSASEWERLMGEVLTYAGSGASEVTPARSSAGHGTQTAARDQPQPHDTPTGHPAPAAIGVSDPMRELALSLAGLTSVLAAERSAPRLRRIERDDVGRITAVIDE